MVRVKIIYFVLAGLEVLFIFEAIVNHKFKNLVSSFASVFKCQTSSVEFQALQFTSRQIIIFQVKELKVRKLECIM